MKLIQTISLHFQSDNSDKVYIVELFEVGEDQFLVNFKFGRRGKPLREGTKTKLPVNREKADQIVAKLVGEKNRKGYTSVNDVDAIGEEESVAEVPINGTLSEQSQAILTRLNNAVLGCEMKSEWPTSRVVWRAGELRLAEAEKDLLEVCKVVEKEGSKEAQLIYSLIWTLGRLNSKEAKPFFTLWKKDTTLPSYINRLAIAALLRIADENEKQTITQELSDRLFSLTHQESQEDGPDPKALVIRYFLKEIQPEWAQTLNHELTQLSLKPPFFRSFRHIFKIAEWQDDAETWALITHKIEREAAFYNSPEWGPEVYIDGQWVDASTEVKKSNSKLGYSNKTRYYFKRRILRRLNRMGQTADPIYVHMAAQLLLTFDDEKHGQQPYYMDTTTYDYNVVTRRYTPLLSRIHYDFNARYLSFYQILFANSPRYQLNRQGNAWICQGDYEPGNPIPTVREEAFPELWDKAGDLLLQLLQQSKSVQVHQFAGRALLENKGLATLINPTILADLFQSPFESTQEFARQCARRIYDENKAQPQLMLAMLAAPLETAQRQAKAWIELKKGEYFSDSVFLIDCFLIPYPAHHSWLQEELKHHTIDMKQAQEIIESVCNRVLDGKELTTHANLIGESLTSCFAEATAEMPIQIIQKLLEANNPHIQILGAKLLLANNVSISAFPASIFQNLLQAENEELNVLGINMFNKLSDKQLLERKTVLVDLCKDEKEGVRTVALAVVNRLLQKQGPDAEKLSFELLEVGFTNIQEVGGTYLIKHLDLSKTPMDQVVRLGKHELLSLREFCQNYFSENLSRIKYEREDALNILDTDWPDTQQFAFDYLRNNFEAKDWTADILISLCDSVRPEVQDFGQEMITRFFEEKDGPTYLLKLSQHPDPRMQRFATNFLERYAGDDIQILKQLKLYFTTVLSQVNKNRAAKARIMAFLTEQALRDPDRATLISEIIHRQMNTSNKGDQSDYLMLLLAISQKFPHLETAWKLTEIPTWNRN